MIRRARSHQRQWAAFVQLVAACSTSAPEADECVELAAPAIYGGSADAGVAGDGASLDLTRAIGEIVSDVGETICTATRIAPGWVLTAAHPLLGRAENAEQFEVIGVLARGSASCTGLDEYIRASAFAEWAEQAVLRGCGDADNHHGLQDE